MSRVLTKLQFPKLMHHIRGMCQAYLYEGLLPEQVASVEQHFMTLEEIAKQRDFDVQINFETVPLTQTTIIKIEMRPKG